MSATKNFYHDQICEGLYGLTPLQEAQILEQEACSYELEAPQGVSHTNPQTQLEL
jgi:hypothetical protein